MSLLRFSFSPSKAETRAVSDFLGPKTELFQFSSFTATNYVLSQSTTRCHQTTSIKHMYGLYMDYI